jgi:outer membrane protein
MLIWRSRLAVVLMLLLIHFAVGHVIAQDTPPELDLSQPLTLEQCIQLALENSSSMRNARIDAVLAELRVKDARARYYPDIFLTGRYSFSDRVDFGFERENYDAGLNGRYTLWDNGQREANLAQSKESEAATINRNERTKQNLIFQVTQAYYDVLEAQELVKVSLELLARSRENTARTEAFVEAGILIEADVATAQVREANDELSLLSNENALNIALATLPQLMGFRPATPITVAEDTDFQRYLNTGKIDVLDIPIEDAIQLAFENRPELKEIQASIKQLEWALTLAKLERWPRLNAEYNYNVNLDDYLHERENFKDFQSWDVTATLNFTIFDGGVTKRQVQQVELQLEQTREDASELERSIALEVRQAYLNLQRAARSVTISDTQVRNAQLSLEVIQGRFEQELAILLELLDAQTAAAQTLTNQVRTFYDYKITQVALERAMGQLQ